MLALLSQIYKPLEKASNHAVRVEGLYDFIYYFCVVSFVLSIAAIVWFLLRYRRSQTNPEKTPYIHGNNALELGVIVVLLVVVMVIFYWGWVDFKALRQIHPDAIEINVTARQWGWDFQYTNGRVADPNRSEVMNGTKYPVPEIVVPRGKPIRLLMTSKSDEVLHSFYVPAFRIKQDVVPGKYTTLSFVPNQVTAQEGHIVYCAEYCGAQHSGMMARIKVVEPAEYEHWQKQWEWEARLGKPASEWDQLSLKVESAPAKPVLPESVPQVSTQPATQPSPQVIIETPIERGRKLFDAKACASCHTTDGKSLVGPTLKGLFGNEVELDDGSKIKADENYLRESITDPAKLGVKGFPKQMPPYKGTLSDQELADIISYIKSLSN